NGREEDGATIVPDIVGRWVGLGEVAVSKGTARQVLEVDVESLVVTLAESLLHGELGAVGEVRVVGGEGGTLEDKLDTSIGKVGIEDGQLLKLLERILRMPRDARQRIENLPVGQAWIEECYPEPRWFRSEGRGTRCRRRW